jgi:hypothetical protein
MGFALWHIRVYGWNWKNKLSRLMNHFTLIGHFLGFGSFDMSQLISDAESRLLLAQ